MTPWWYRYIDEYFEFDKESGLYALKPGKSLESLKLLAPKPEAPKDPADPNSWPISLKDLGSGKAKTFYDKVYVEKYLSSGIIDRFFEPITNKFKIKVFVVEECIAGKALLLAIDKRWAVFNFK